MRKIMLKHKWLMMQQKKPDDFIIATGKQYSVRQFVEKAASALNMSITWDGKGINERGLFDGKEIVKISEKYFRPTEVDSLLGDYSKAKNILGWVPKITFDELVKEMIDEDLKIAKKEQFSKNKI